MFLKNENIVFKIRRSKVTDYAALSVFIFIHTYMAIHEGKPEMVKHTYMSSYPVGLGTLILARASILISSV